MLSNRWVKISLMIILLASFAPVAESDSSVDSSSQEALTDTQALLRNRQRRDAAIKESPDAQSNHQGLEKLVGPAGVDGVYDVSADIFGKIVKDSNGDPNVMSQKLIEAQKNPEAFLNSLTPEQRAKIKGIADKAEMQNKPAGRP